MASNRYTMLSPVRQLHERLEVGREPRSGKAKFSLVQV
jgi:hypothetical protein